ncbi:hypothetical protein ACG1BZ_07715 [Microbulbifer sp. CNSA002]|uniref:hypothetical protein n=1 Tax=unclassified Microbulbifer TaxID=2619833 RepID=UPI0039B5280C
MKIFLALSVLGFFLTPSPVVAVSKADLMTNSAIGQMPSQSFPSSGSEYWIEREQAVSFAKTDDWEKAIPLLEKLTAQYKDDGDTWFLLGHGYIKTNQCNKAIPSLKRTLELGTIMSGIRSASSPSNDIMIKIAQCHSKMKEKDQALGWIQKALDSRWDDRKSLIGSSDFQHISQDDMYKELSGESQLENLSRDERWMTDLNFLADEILRLHVNPYHHSSKEDLALHINEIKTEIPHLTDQQIVFRMMALLASLGNGHNFIVPTHSRNGSFSKLPIQLYWFNDGIFIVGADTEYKHLVGKKLLSVANQPIDAVMKKIATVNARDNEMQQYWLGPYYLALPEVLEGLGIVESASKIPLTLEEKSGAKEQVVLSGKPFNFTGFPTLPAPNNRDNLLYLRNKKENYWLEYNSDNDLLYLQFNRVAQDKSHPLDVFSKKITAFTKGRKVKNLVLDLRHNSGGNGSIIPPLTRSLIHFSENSEENNLFVIIGRNTFSAAHLLLADLDRLTDIIIVGEPSGSRPNHLGEAGWFKLPYSGVWGIISSQYHQASKAEDHRIWIAPHVPATLSSEEYFAGEDPAINHIIRIISHKKEKAAIPSPGSVITAGF